MPLRTALVTGGNRGIGLEVCRRLAALDYRVLLAGRNQEAVNASAVLFGREGARVEARLLDVTDERGIRSLADQVDVLVNNAAVLLGEDQDVLSAPADDFRRSMEANVYGPLLLCQVLM